MKTRAKYRRLSRIGVKPRNEFPERLSVVNPYRVFGKPGEIQVDTPDGE